MKHFPNRNVIHGDLPGTTKESLARHLKPLIAVSGQPF